MNTLFDEEIRGHHLMRDHVLTLVTDADLAHPMPGNNPTLGELLIELGDLQGVYTHSFASGNLDWTHRHSRPPEPVTVADLQEWFASHDQAMQTALNQYTDAELRVDKIDRGNGFIASLFVQHEIYREAVYIAYGKLSVYLKALQRHPGENWTAWIG